MWWIYRLPYSMVVYHNILNHNPCIMMCILLPDSCQYHSPTKKALLRFLWRKRPAGGIQTAPSQFHTIKEDNSKPSIKPTNQFNSLSWTHSFLFFFSLLFRLLVIIIITYAQVLRPLWMIFLWVSLFIWFHTLSRGCCSQGFWNI